MSPSSFAAELMALLDKRGLHLDADLQRDGLRFLAQSFMELEVSAFIDASPYERRGSRLAYRNGYRARAWQTGVGVIRLDIPKLRKGTYYPRFLDFPARVERVLLTVLQETYVQGVTRHLLNEALAKLGLPPAPPNSLAHFAEQLDELLARHRQRLLRAAYPYLWLHVVRVESGHPLIPTQRSVAVAVGLGGDEQAYLLNLKVARGVEDEAFWVAFLRDLRDSGLHDVEVVISDAYRGVRAAVREVLPDAGWCYSPARTLPQIKEALQAATPAIAVAAIATQFVQVPIEDSQLPTSLLMLPHADYTATLSSAVLQRLKQAVTQQGDAVATMTLADLVDDSGWFVEPVHELPEISFAQYAIA
jgi:hypothetical protein